MLTRIVLAEDEPDHAPRVAQSLDVQRALSRLRPLDQEVLRLIEWDDLTQASAAALLGCSRAALAVRIRRARTRFAKALDIESPNGEPRPPVPTPQEATPGSSPESPLSVAPGPAGQLYDDPDPISQREPEVAASAVPHQAERSAR